MRDKRSRDMMEEDRGKMKEGMILKMKMERLNQCNQVLAAGLELLGPARGLAAGPG